MLSLTWNAPPNLPHARPRHTHVVLQFEALDDATTAVEPHHLGWPDDEWEEHDAWAETFEYFEAAWARVLEMLADYGDRD